nr:hypothetical protein [Bacillus sp. 491mf]
MLDIDLPVLNREETKKNVLQALKKYCLFLSNIDEQIIERVYEGETDGIRGKIIKRVSYIMDIRKGASAGDAVVEQINNAGAYDVHYRYGKWIFVNGGGLKEGGWMYFAESYVNWLR